MSAPRPGSIFLRTSMRSCWVRFARHRERNALVMLVLGCVITLVVPVVSVYSYKQYEPIYRHAGWSRSVEKLPAGSFGVVRRPLWCGAIYAVIPEDRVTYMEGRLGGGSIGAHGVATATGSVAQWNANIDPLVPEGVFASSDLRLLAMETLPEREYTEVLVLGWPARSAVSSGTTTLDDLTVGQHMVYRGNLIDLARQGAFTVNAPRVLVGKFPLRVRWMGLVANAAFWTLVSGPVVIGVVWASSCVRIMRGKCPACAYAAAPSGHRCSECGFVLGA